MSAQDEIFLWGLLALTLRQPQPSAEFHATPHFCLGQLGLIDAGSRRGGRQYRQFRDAIERLSVVRYLNDRFYDPMRAEHRQVSFGFFSYSLPTDANSNRAWRFYWDPLFFEFAKAVGGGLHFDLELYRQLNPASRRLFLLASKVFPRRFIVSFELRQLAVEVLGLSPTLIPRDQLAKTRRCLSQLASHGVVSPSDSQTVRKLGRGRYAVTLGMGDYFRRPACKPKPDPVAQSPLTEGLREIGLDTPAICRHLKKFSHHLLREWSDITLAARERFGASFFKRSPAAYFVDNVKHAAAGQRTAPDWWHGVRKAEEARRDEQLRKSLNVRGLTVRTGESTGGGNSLTPVAQILSRLPTKSD